MSEFTESQLREMDDLDLNLAFIKSQGFEVIYAAGSEVCYSDGLCNIAFNCIDPRCVMPFIEEKRIALLPLLDSDKWTATNNAYSYMTDSSFRFKEEGGFSFFDQSPYRAAVCLILLMGK